MESTTKIIMLAVAVCIAAIFISACFLLYAGVNSGSLGYNATLNKVFGRSKGPAFARYEGKIVDGDFVRSMISEYGGDYFIRIRTDKCPETFSTYSNGKNSALIESSLASGGAQSKTEIEYMSLQDTTAKTYVNPTDLFRVSLVYQSRDKNGNPVLASVGNSGDLAGVYFEQDSKSGRGASQTELSAKNTQLATIYSMYKDVNWQSKIDNVITKNSELEKKIAKMQEDTSLNLNDTNSSLVNKFNNAYKLYNKNYESCENKIQQLISQFNDQNKDLGEQIAKDAYVELDPEVIKFNTNSSSDDSGDISSKDNSVLCLGYYVQNYLSTIPGGNSLEGTNWNNYVNNYASAGW